MCVKYKIISNNFQIKKLFRMSLQQFLDECDRDSLGLIKEMAKSIDLGSVLKGHTSFVMSCSFSSDDKFVITGSGDETAMIWCVETGKCLKVLKDHTDYVTSCSFSSNDKFAITGSWDKTVMIWDLTKI